MWEVLKAPSINMGVATLDRNPTWMDKIISLSKDGVLPQDGLEAKKSTKASSIVYLPGGQL